jgi:pSer/pThr/pTyr-binding forkhead associated (FHA) protein
MKWSLMVDRGKYKGMIIPIQESPFLIGRSNECQLRAADLYVSHRHCELLTQDGKIVLRDCNSTNGTFVNSQRVEGEVELHENDLLKIESLAFMVCHEDVQPIEESPAELVSPKPSGTADEEAMEDILLKLDEEDVGHAGPCPAPGGV